MTKEVQSMKPALNALKHRLPPGLCCQLLNLLRSDNPSCGLIFQRLNHCLAYHVNFQWFLGHGSEEPKFVSEEVIELGRDEATKSDWQCEFSAWIVHEARTNEDAPQLGE